MICDCCKTDKLVSEFIKSENICYKCMYQIKLSKVTENRTMKPRLCRICKKEIIYEENAKKRQRDVFCSHECAKKGHKDQLQNHWTRKIMTNEILRANYPDNFHPLKGGKIGYNMEYQVEQI